MAEVESKLSSAEEALLGSVNEDADHGDRLGSVTPAATSLALTQVLCRRFEDVRHSAEVRRAELEVAVELSQKFDDNLRDVSGRLDEIARDAETHCELPGAAKVEELQHHAIEQKVPFDKILFLFF